MRHLLALTLALGCRSEPRDAPAGGASAASPPSPAGSAPAAAPSPSGAAAPSAPSPSADALPARGGPDDPLAEKLRHCPVTVDGATTALRDIPAGIEVTVTAPDPAAATEIQRRAAHMVAFTAGRANRGEHGGGAGGGFMQNCPVVARSTTIDATHIPRGAVLLVRPTGDLTIAALRTETRRRQSALITP